MNKLELVCYGELLAGFELDDVKQNVATMFKANLSQVERMFSGDRVVIRNKLDRETAFKYVQAMAKRGAICKVEIMGQPGVELDNSSPPSDTVVETPAPKPVESITPAPSDAVPPPTPTETVAASPEVQTESGSNTGMQVAGEKVDSILSDSHLTLAPVGERLSEKVPPSPAPNLQEIEGMELLPVGSDMQEKKDSPPVSVPDVSHLSLDDDDK